MSLLQPPGHHTLASARRSEGGGGGQYVVVQQRVGAATCPVHCLQEGEEGEGDALRAPALIRSSSVRAGPVPRHRHTAPASPRPAAGLATIKEDTFTQHTCVYFEPKIKSARQQVWCV